MVCGDGAAAARRRGHLSIACKMNPGYLDKLNCLDEEADCDGWREDGECAANPTWMAWKCPRSCGVCTPRKHAFHHVPSPSANRAIASVLSVLAAVVSSHQHVQLARHAVRFAERLEALGAHHESHVVEGAPHGFDRVAPGDDARRLIERSRTFLVETLGEERS